MGGEEVKPELYLRAARQWLGSPDCGVVLTMGPHPRLLSWIGLLSVVVGVWLLDNPPEGGLLPINQVLLALDSALVTIWAFVFLVRGRG